MLLISNIPVLLRSRVGKWKGTRSRCSFHFVKSDSYAFLHIMWKIKMHSSNKTSVLILEILKIYVYPLTLCWYVTNLITVSKSIHHDKTGREITHFKGIQMIFYHSQYVETNISRKKKLTNSNVGILEKYKIPTRNSIININNYGICSFDCSAIKEIISI